MGLREDILEKAQKFIQRGQFDKAIAEYRNAADADPRDVSIRLRIGDLFVKMGRQEDAVKEYMDVARANTQKGFYLKAIAVYKQVLKLDAANIDVHNKLAELYTKQRLIVDAVSEYSFLVSAFEKKGRVGDAMDILKKMIGIDPENVGIRLKIADFYHEQGFDKDALVEYSVIFSKLMAQGKADKAEKIYHTILHVYPVEPQIFTGLCDIYKNKADTAQYLKYAHKLADIYRNKGEVDSAKAVAQEILAAVPDDAESLDFLNRFNVSAAMEKAQEGPKKPLPEAVDIHEHVEEPLIDFNLIEAEASPKAQRPGNALEEKETKAGEAPLIEMPEMPTAATAPPPAAEPVEEAPLISLSEAAPPSAVPEIEMDIEMEGFETPAAHSGARAVPEAGAEISEVIEPVEAEPVEEAAFKPEAPVAPSRPVEAPVHAESGAEGMARPGEEEFVDLAAEIGLEELGMEEAVKDMAESFTAGAGKDTAEEFESGIESQLGKEDSETHYNLGIAYMEMELFNEACKQFKIAVKDPAIEFYCLTRLGLCCMSLSKPDEAVQYYLKALKVKNRGEDERKGAMYELALAYESAGNRGDAAGLYRSIHALDPGYREAAAKVKEFEGKAAARGEGWAPTDDGTLEVELL